MNLFFTKCYNLNIVNFFIQFIYGIHLNAAIFKRCVIDVPSIKNIHESIHDSRWMKNQNML